jgi:hypothetical protein
MFDSPSAQPDRVPIACKKTVRVGVTLFLALVGLTMLPSCAMENGIGVEPGGVTPQAASQLCPNGTWIAQTEICPPPPPASEPPAFATKTCLDGTVVTATEICSSQVCPDGSRIPSSQICPQPLDAMLARVQWRRKA